MSERRPLSERIVELDTGHPEWKPLVGIAFALVAGALSQILGLDWGLAVAIGLMASDGLSAASEGRRA